MSLGKDEWVKSLTTYRHRKTLFGLEVFFLFPGSNSWHYEIIVLLVCLLRFSVSRFLVIINLIIAFHIKTCIQYACFWLHLECKSPPSPVLLFRLSSPEVDLFPDPGMHLPTVSNRLTLQLYFKYSWSIENFSLFHGIRDSVIMLTYWTTVCWCRNATYTILRYSSITAIWLSYLL